MCCVQQCLLLMWKACHSGQTHNLTGDLLYSMSLSLCLFPSYTHITCSHVFLTGKEIIHKPYIVDKSHRIGHCEGGGEMMKEAVHMPLSVVASFIFIF